MAGKKKAPKGKGVVAKVPYGAPGGKNPFSGAMAAAAGGGKKKGK